MTFSTAMRSNDKSKIINQRSKIFLPLVLCFFALLVRIVPVIADTVHFSFDQGLDMILVKQLVVDHKFGLVSRYSGLQGVLMGPLWTWFLAIPFFFSGGTPSANVVFLSLLSVFSALATFLIIRKFLGETIGFITFLFSLFAPYFVANSQIVLSPHPLTYLFIFYLWFVFEVFIRQRSVFWIPLGLLTGIFFQFEVAFAVPALVAIGVLAVVFVGPTLRMIFNVRFLLGFAIFGLTFIPQVLFDLRHDFLITKSLLAFIGGDSNSLYREVPSLLTRFALRIRSFTEDFLAMTVGTMTAPVITGSLLVMILGWWEAIKSRRREALFVGKLLAIIILTFYFIFSLYPGAIWGWYRQGLPIVYVLILAIPLGVIFDKVRSLRILLLLVGLVFLYSWINPRGLAAGLRGEAGSVGALREQKQVLDYIYRSAGGQQFSYFAYTPPVYDYIWRYDFWWYGKSRYGYFPQNFQMGVPLLGIGKQGAPPREDEGLFFLIIEPDSEKPWAPLGWQKSFIKVGKTEERREFPSGIVVERRRT